MSSFGQVVPILGTAMGFLGEVTRTGGGDPFIISKQANVNNAANINFGDAVVILPDSTGGTCKAFADWQANGGGLAVVGVTGSNTTFTPSAASCAGISNGMLIFGSGIPAGTFVSAVNYAAGTITMSKAATSSLNTVTLYFAKFAGFAVREVKSMTAYVPTAGGAIPGNTIGNYLPGQYTGILVRGGILVKVPVGTPVSNGPAYLRAILNGGIAAGLLGSIEANADGVNNLLLANIPGIASAFFKTGATDAASTGLYELILENRHAA
jgi:hypothetical protein